MKRVGLVLLAIIAVACTGDERLARLEEERQSAEIVVGSFNFTENQVLAEIYAFALESNGYPVRRLHDVASREIMEPAVEQAFVDFVVEYQGTALNFLQLTREPLGASPKTMYERLEEELETRDIVAFDFAPVESKNEVVVSATTAAEHDLVNISDLEPLAPEMVFGGPPECPSRPLCLEGLESTYGLEFGTFQPLDAGGPLTAAALASGEIDAGILFTTSPALVTGELTVLKDDLGLQPPENIVPLARREVVSLHGSRLVRLVDSISARLTTLDLRTLNQRVDVGGENPNKVARDWVRDQGLDR